MLFKPRTDPRDELIAALKDERDYLRERLASKEKEILAIRDAHAYTLVHPEEPRTPRPKPADDTSPYSRSTQEYVPSFSLERVQREIDRAQGHTTTPKED